MTNPAKTALLATLMLPGAALAQINAGDALGTTDTAIRAALEAQGYITTDVDIEKDEIEIEVMRGGKFFEIEVSPDTGLVVAVAEEDGPDEDDDEDEDDDSDSDDDDEDGYDDGDDDEDEDDGDEDEDEDEDEEDDDDDEDN